MFSRRAGPLAPLFLLPCLLLYMYTNSIWIDLAKVYFKNLEYTGTIPSPWQGVLWIYNIVNGMVDIFTILLLKKTIREEQLTRKVGMEGPTFLLLHIRTRKKKAD